MIHDGLCVLNSQFSYSIQLCYVKSLYQVVYMAGIQGMWQQLKYRLL